MVRFVGLLLLAACGSESSGPIARIQRFTECVVPSGAVRVHEDLGGDAERFVIHVKVVIPKTSADDYVRSCGFTPGSLQRGYDHHSMLPETALPWWAPPDRQLVTGAAREDGTFRSELVLVERDTDFAVYVKASGTAD